MEVEKTSLRREDKTETENCETQNKIRVYPELTWSLFRKRPEHTQSLPGTHSVQHTVGREEAVNHSQ